MKHRHSESRRFNSRQRVALFLAARGACARCGSELGSVWHADHVLAYSRNGKTDAVNGQALCPPCNLRKGTGDGANPAAANPANFTAEPDGE